MDNIEYKLQKRRNHFRKRRNVLRRVLLIVLMLFFIFGVYKLYKFPEGKRIKIRIFNSQITNNHELKSLIKLGVSNGFYGLSTKDLSRSVLNEIPVLKNIVIRKYLFPALEINCYLNEKAVWGKYICEDEGHDVYILDDGEKTLAKYLNLDNLKESELKKLCFKQEISNEKMQSLMQILDKIDKQKIVIINKVTLAEDGNIQFVTDENVLIKAGKFDEDLTERVSKLNDAITVVQQKDYKVSYIDLTLDNSVAIKKESKGNSSAKEEVIEAKKNIFGRSEY